MVIQFQEKNQTARWKPISTSAHTEKLTQGLKWRKLCLITAQGLHKGEQ